ncbi:hypothetical protein HDU97_001965 [Phlyctochytrium planicorne]|nr:hypothetical protein HDU97_001965 [Phlyctochytrium planicorne]
MAAGSHEEQKMSTPSTATTTCVETPSSPSSRTTRRKFSATSLKPSSLTTSIPLPPSSPISLLSVPASTTLRVLLEALTTGQLKDHSIDDAVHDLVWMLDRILHSRLARSSSTSAASQQVTHSFLFSRAWEDGKDSKNTMGLLDNLHSDSAKMKGLETAIAGLLPSELERLRAWIHDRAVRHKPLQYILGTQPFAGLEIAVRPPTLIPRWETEEWTMRLVDMIKSNKDSFATDLKSTPYTRTKGSRSHVGPLRVLDVCTGSGCIAVALAHHLGKPSGPSAANAADKVIPSMVVGVDISKRSLQLAKLNARKCFIPDTSSVLFLERDIMEDPCPPTSSTSPKSSSPASPASPASPESSSWSNLGLGTCLRQPVKFDIIVSNPPYIPPAEYEQLDPSVKDWEDPLALVTSSKPTSRGTEFHERILEISTELLDRSVEFPKNVPRLVMEVSAGIVEGASKNQAEIVKEMMESSGFGRAEVWKDLAGRPRAVAGFELL